MKSFKNVKELRELLEDYPDDLPIVRSIEGFNHFYFQLSTVSLALANEDVKCLYNTRDIIERKTEILILT